MGSATMAASEDLQTWVLQFVCVWALGLVLGWLLPKPKWVDRGLRAKALVLSSPPGLWVRRAVLAAHLAAIVREIWRNLFAPGTFRGVLKALWRTLTTGQRFEWPSPACDEAAGAAASPSADVAADSDSWYVSSKDLAQFKWTIDEDGRPEGASGWELMMSKQWPGCTYTAWRRTLASGKSEYKSVTISEDATAEEFMDFYLDDLTRMKWDAMISETNLLESGDTASRCQVVRWLRTFPFAFISQREYVIARRFFREADGSLYAVTKGVEHPSAPVTSGVVRMENFHSHWRSRTVPCPHGSGRPACETWLLHFEDFKIPERLARFAVRHGMAGFVKGMIPAVQAFVAERRSRCEPFAEDPDSFGRRQALRQPGTLMADAAGAALLARTASGSSLSLSGSDSVCSGDSLEDSASEHSGMALHRSGSMRRLGIMMVASGVAMAIARTASSGTLSASGASPQRRSATATPSKQRQAQATGGSSGGEQQQATAKQAAHAHAHSPSKHVHTPSKLSHTPSKHHGHGHGHYAANRPFRRYADFASRVQRRHQEQQAAAAAAAAASADRS